MGDCRICGERTVTERTFCFGCLHRELNRIAERLCDNICKWSESCQTQEELDEHCADCDMGEFFRRIL